MNLLTRVFVTPTESRTLSLVQWDLLVRQARHANLLGRLHALLDRHGLLATAPERARHHMQSAATMAARQHQSIRHEAALLAQTLAPLDQPLVLLKGAAYVLADLPAASGRVFADLDILVARPKLDRIESALMLAGWVSANLDAYDQRYYRRWMHELPAMQHLFRGTALDVHHTILPPTSRLHPDPAALLAASVQVPGQPGMRVLAPADMVLHSASHLFHEGEPDNLLRDLSDLDLLLRHFPTAQPAQDFWLHLVERAKVLQLTSPLRLALRYCHTLLQTPIPAETLAATGATRRRQGSDALLDFIYGRVLRPRHSSAADRASGLCEKLLYVRAHWLRMPPHLLAYHLTRKALRPATTVPHVPAEPAR